MVTVPGQFGPWRPDLPDINNAGVTVARNVIPAFGNGSVTYKPLRSGQLYANTTMLSRPRGSGVARAPQGETRVYAGCSERLYRLNELDKQWIDVSRPAKYVTSDNDNWQFTDWGNIMIATNYSDWPQFISKELNDQFQDLTTLVKARYSAFVRGFNVFANTWDNLDFAVPYRVRWSAVNDPGDYNFSPSTMSDFQDIFDGGSIMGIVGGEAGYVFMQSCIVKMIYIGAPFVFDFYKLPSSIGRGCIAPQSIITVQGVTYYLSGDGFYQLDHATGTVSPIGAGKVNNWFKGDADPANYVYMTSAADPIKNLIYWCYVGTGGAVGVPDSMVVYNYQIQEWTQTEASMPFIFNAISLPATLEDLAVYGDIANIPAPFDSPIWAGGTQLLWGFDTQGRIYTFGGQNLEGVLETQEMFLIRNLQAVDPRIQGEKTQVKKVRPIYHGDGTCRVQVKYRNKSFDDILTTSAVEPHAETQWAYFNRIPGRFHRVKFTFSGEYDAVVSFEIDAISAGSR